MENDCFTGVGSFVLGREGVLEPDSGGDCTTLHGLNVTRGTFYATCILSLQFKNKTRQEV